MFLTLQQGSVRLGEKPGVLVPPTGPSFAPVLSTDSLSWLIPARPECLALLSCSRSLAWLMGTGPPYAPGDPSQASATLQDWAGA